jgi:hypothetical protein
MKVFWDSGGKDLHTLNSTEITSQLLSNSYVITRKVRMLSALRPQQRYRVYCVHRTT